tara:strand:- start:2700 stop:2891 length:192 start_codon:yes stop_codon:yes gene_type:complete
LRLLSAEYARKPRNQLGAAEATAVVVSPSSTRLMLFVLATATATATATAADDRVPVTWYGRVW